MSRRGGECDYELKPRGPSPPSSDKKDHIPEVDSSSVKSLCGGDLKRAPDSSSRQSTPSSDSSSSPVSSTLSTSSSPSSAEVECPLGAGIAEGRCSSSTSPFSSLPKAVASRESLTMSGDADRGWRRGSADRAMHHKLDESASPKPDLSASLKREQLGGDYIDDDGGGGSLPTLDPSSLQLQNNLQFRFLHPDDIDELKTLCKDCFPVEYPEEWYQEITKDDGRFFSLASTLRGKIVGFIVAEIKTRVRCNKEDQDILSPSYPLSTPIAYILSLGVLCPFRCQGVGSLLLDNLLNHLTSKDHHTCKAVFLHVLCTNSRAIRFYERRHFAKHSFLPLYYSIQGKLKDGYSYVLYLNGGHPPWSLRSSIAALASFSPCKMSSKLFLRFNQLLWCFLAAVFFSIRRTTATSATTSSTSTTATTTSNAFPHAYHKS